jgi:hypothetical protein
MPRRAKGPYLYWIEYKNGRASQWVIRDGAKMRSTGLGDGASENEKSAALAKYLIEKHDPKPKGVDNPNQALVADCLNVYLEKKLAAYVPPESDRRAHSRRDEDRKMVQSLLDYFGLMTVGEVTGAAQKEYAARRTTANMARRELVILSAAINDYFRDQGGFSMVFRAIVPDQPSRRERFLTRQQAAQQVRAAWRKRQVNRGGGLGRFTGKHTARMMLVGFYTGSRCGAICNAATMPTIGRSYVDYDAGVFYRQAQGRHLTNKSQNAKPSPIPAPAARSHAALEAAGHFQPFGDRVERQAGEEPVPGLHGGDAPCRAGDGQPEPEGRPAYDAAHRCHLVPAGGREPRTGGRLRRHVGCHAEGSLPAPHAGAFRADHAGVLSLRPHRAGPEIRNSYVTVSDERRRHKPR